MTRTIILAAPSEQLGQILGHPSGRWIYSLGQPVWEDHDMRREEIAKGLHANPRADEINPEPNRSARV